MNHKFVDLTGQKLNLLTVLELSHIEKGQRIWKCKCDCGRITYVSTNKLKNKNTKSCGCLRHKTKTNLKHNKHNTRLYHIWNGMKQRCNNPNTIKYQNYGGRGIKVCKEWQNDFIAFYNWAIENGYDETKSRKEQSIDRINVNGNYEPNNCRWVTQSENCRNRNNNVYLTKNGITKTIVVWCEEFNLNQKLVSHRAKIYNNVDEILSKENLLRKKHKSNTGEYGISKDKKGKYQLYLKHEYIGQFKTLQEAIERRENILNGIEY